MGWYAKPSGAYSIESNEAHQNMFMISEYLQTQGWTQVAVASLLGNMKEESGFNPWRWFNDTYDMTTSYGLVQFHPSSYYIGGRGLDFPDYYAPNLSTTQTTQGALASDGRAQLEVMETYHSDKFIDRSSYCDFLDISSAYPYEDFKQLTNLWIGTVGWLYDYEFPSAQYRDYAHAYQRYLSAQRCYEIITGQQPPEPPDPPHPPIPIRSKMKLYMMMGKAMRYKKGNL